MLTATMALLALISASVTASPIMNIIDRVSVEFGEESNDVLRTMKDIDITDRNMDDWWKTYNAQIAAFKQTIAGKDITKENKDADPLVCTKHKTMMATLNAVKTQWGKVWSAWEAKNLLLNMIWDILNDDKKQNKNESGLHCKKDGQSGAAKQLCNLLTTLRAKSVKEETELKKEKVTIDTYIKNVTEYKCDCTFTDWDGPFNQCTGGTVKPVDIYKTCENAETMKEVDGKLKCKPEKSFCGAGTQFKTRTRKWDAKNGGTGETGKVCQVGKANEGTYSPVGKDEKQRLTANCKAGEYDGNCPVDCEWGEWKGDIDTAACPAQSCSDNGKEKSKQVITREKKKKRQFGGKFCFQDAKGHYDTHSQPCGFETTATLAQNKLAHDKDKYANLVKVLKAEMCKDGTGPCGDNGNCEVKTNDDGKVTSWCTCKTGYKGKWCEQAPEKEEEKAKWVQTTVKVFMGSSGCQVIRPVFKDLGLDTCQAKCLAGGANAMNYMASEGLCVCWNCKGNPPTPTATPEGGMVGYYLQ